MANLGREGGIFHVRFRYDGRAVQASLKIDVRDDAEAALRTVELTINRLHVGLPAVPSGVDPGDFIVSGGTKTAEAAEAALKPLIARANCPTSFGCSEFLNTTSTICGHSSRQSANRNSPSTNSQRTSAGRATRFAAGSPMAAFAQSVFRELGRVVDCKSLARSSIPQ